MKKILPLLIAVMVSLLFVAGCSGKKSSMTVNPGSVEPGGIVQRGDARLQLIGTPLRVGMQLPDLVLTDALAMEDFPLSRFMGKVVILSIVPSLDTKVCEEQTHYLAEKGGRLPADVLRVTISRDTPFAQKRFAEEAKMTDIRYLSDHRDASFGMATGLLVDKNRLLARSVVVADRSGTVRYIQVVPQLGELPDLERAFAEAMKLVE